MTRVPVTIEWVNKLWPGWVASRVSNRTIYVCKGVRLTEAFLAHELRHVVQRDELGWRFLFAYLAGHVLGGFSHAGNWMENEARAAERDPAYLTWARELLAAGGVLHGV